VEPPEYAFREGRAAPGGRSTLISLRGVTYTGKANSMRGWGAGVFRAVAGKGFYERESAGLKRPGYIYCWF
jgi:hypothetical protein